ncbi:MAG: T9SS type A sorting domain-containing protein [Bacteroidetes bacterium]|nr:T9SS type A sorting domain-containing protein [Bacteroidota bacterium]
MKTASKNQNFENVIVFKINSIAFTLLTLLCVNILSAQHLKDDFSSLGIIKLTGEVKLTYKYQSFNLTNVNKANDFYPDRFLNWAWDTIVEYDTIGLSERMVRTINAEGKVVDYIFQVWENSTWINDEMFLYMYNNDGNLETVLNKGWENNAWVITMRYTYFYDSIGNMVEELGEGLHNNVWVNSWRNIYQYDSNGNIIEQLNEWWQNIDWVNDQRTTYLCDSSGNDLIVVVENWDNNNWKYSYRSSYSYDSNGNKITSMYENWDIWEGDWTYSSRESYSYDYNDNLLSKIREDWEDSLWVYLGKDTYMYNGLGKVISWLYEVWQNDEWIYYSFSTYSYDVDQNLIAQLFEKWSDSTWTNCALLTYTFDANHNSIAGKFEQWINGDWHISSANVDLCIFTNGEIDLKIYNRYRYEASFQSFTSGIDNEDNNKFDCSLIISPNPSSGNFTISFSRIENQTAKLTVTNTLGEIVKTIELVSGQTDYNVDISGAAAGVYFVSLQTDNGSAVQKIVVE